MTRDATHAAEIRETAIAVRRLHAAAEGYETHAAHAGAELHAVLYGKVADALADARDALETAADLMDPNATDVLATEDADA